MPIDGSQSLNQGQFGTCVAHAFAQALIQGLSQKYNIACDASTFVTTVKARCPCWNGHRTEQMPRDWNVKHAEEGAAIEDVDKTCRYNVRVEFREIHSFEEARCEMQRAQILGMYMPCTITTSADGHSRHSVALTKCYQGTDEMYAVNSWGAKDKHLDVTRQNFKVAITFDTIITAATGGNGLSMPVPEPHRSYTDALHSLSPQGELERAALEKKLKEEMEQKRLVAAAKEAANGFFVLVCESASVATCVLSVPKRFPVRGRLIM
mmetsp:Transcript_4662/g.6895  ORF Transcript_4662/g.6895 Transcript_4662/m.6895 type:complete len:265 (+) Transcript_4662:68-862(+)